MADESSDHPVKSMTEAATTAAQHGFQAVQDAGRRAAEGVLAGVAEFTRMFGNLKPSAVPDMDAFLQANRRNMETLSAANRVALEGAQNVAKRHMEIVQQTMQEMTEAIRELSSSDTPQARAAKQAEMVKHGYERAVAHLNELADMIQRSNGEAMEMLDHRFREAMDEVKALVEKSGQKQGS